MLRSFNDFLRAPHRFKNICDNLEMENIFTKILSSQDNIIRMINAIESGITPVSICAKSIENYLESLPNTVITLDRNTNTKDADNNRQAIGAMIAFIIEPFGYLKIKDHNRPIPQPYKGKYLYSGATYEKSGKPTLQIITRIEDI